MLIAWWITTAPHTHTHTHAHAHAHAHMHTHAHTHKRARAHTHTHTHTHTRTHTRPRAHTHTQTRTRTRTHIHTHTHTHTHTPCITWYFPRQEWLHKRVSVLKLYLHYLSCFIVLFSFGFELPCERMLLLSLSRNTLLYLDFNHSKPNSVQCTDFNSSHAACLGAP
jgi:hypothetical protein